jgi:hypothetical protein
MHVAWPILQFVPIGDEPLDTFKQGGRYRVRLKLFGMFSFSSQWIIISLHEPEVGEWPKRLRDNGYSTLISKWDHWITVSPDAYGGTQYSDDVEIRAGMLTPFVWMFAQVFYWHRQRRWRGLVRNQKTSA